MAKALKSMAEVHEDDGLIGREETNLFCTSYCQTARCEGVRENGRWPQAAEP